METLSLSFSGQSPLVKAELNRFLIVKPVGVIMKNLP